MLARFLAKRRFTLPTPSVQPGPPERVFDIHLTHDHVYLKNSFYLMVWLHVGYGRKKQLQYVTGVELV